MPIHDWSRISSGIFHDFHQTWSIHIKAALNSGLLPKGLSALVEQRAGVFEGDVLTVESFQSLRNRDASAAGSLILQDQPKTTIIRKSGSEFYAQLANQIIIRHRLGRIVAVIEIVSPGNKHSRRAMKEFLEMTLAFLNAGVHLLLLAAGMHIQVPLESTYQSTWASSPEMMRIAVETGVMPEPDAEE